MKKFLIFFLIASVSFSFKQSDSDNIVRALKTANASQVSTYFDKMIDIKFPDKR